MTLEHLFSELLVSLATAYSVNFESVRVCVHVMVLGEEVADWVEGGYDESKHTDHDLLVWHLASCDESQVLRNIMSHLRSGRWGSVLILNHTVMKLGRHSDNHVIIVWVEVSAFWDIKTEGWVVVVTSQEVI